MVFSISTEHARGGRATFVATGTPHGGIVAFADMIRSNDNYKLFNELVCRGHLREHTIEESDDGMLSSRFITHDGVDHKVVSGVQHDTNYDRLLAAHLKYAFKVVQAAHRTSHQSRTSQLPTLPPTLSPTLQPRLSWPLQRILGRPRQGHPRRAAQL